MKFKWGKKDQPKPLDILAEASAVAAAADAEEMPEEVARALEMLAVTVAITEMVLLKHGVKLLFELDMEGL